MLRKIAQILVCADKDFYLAKHPVASSHLDADGGELDGTRTGIQQERVAGCRSGPLPVYRVFLQGTKQSFNPAVLPGMIGLGTLMAALLNKLPLNEKFQSVSTSGCILSTYITPFSQAPRYQLTVVGCLQKMASETKMDFDD